MTIHNSNTPFGVSMMCCFSLEWCDPSTLYLLVEKSFNPSNLISLSSLFGSCRRTPTGEAPILFFSVNTFNLMVGCLCSTDCAVLSHSVLYNSATQWTVACQAPLSTRILQARILEWVALSSCRGSSQPREWTRISCSFYTAVRFFTTETPVVNTVGPCGLNIVLMG